MPSAFIFHISYFTLHYSIGADSAEAVRNAAPKPNHIGQGNIALKDEIEHLHFFAFEGYTLLGEKLQNIGNDFVLDVPADALGERKNMRKQLRLEELELCFEGAKLLKMAIILPIERHPVVNAISAEVIGVEFVLTKVEFFDGQGALLFANTHRPIGLREKMVRLFYAFIQAKQHRIIEKTFVLNERVTIVKPLWVGI
jgi:hypothetical protein